MLGQASDALIYEVEVHHAAVAAAGVADRDHGLDLDLEGGQELLSMKNRHE